jgi:exodeoxyribonuclease VII large subunit
LQVDGCGDRSTQAATKLLTGLRQHLEGLARGLPEPRLLMAHAGQRLDDQGERLAQAARTRLHRLDDRVAQLAAGLRPPAQVVREAGVGLDHRFRRLSDLTRDRIATGERELGGWSQRLAAVSLEARAKQAAERLIAGNGRLASCTERRLKEMGHGLDRLAQLLDSLSPHRVLARGYAIVHEADGGRVLPSRAAADSHRRLSVQFVDGAIEVVRTDMPARPRAKAAERTPATQETLL